MGVWFKKNVSHSRSDGFPQDVFLVNHGTMIINLHFFLGGTKTGPFQGDFEPTNGGKNLHNSSKKNHHGI